MRRIPTVNRKKNRNRFNLIDPSTPVSRLRCTKRLRIGLPKRSGLIGFCVSYFCIAYKGGQNPQIKWRFEKLQFRGRYSLDFYWYIWRKSNKILDVLLGVFGKLKFITFCVIYKNQLDDSFSSVSFILSIGGFSVFYSSLEVRSPIEAYDIPGRWFRYVLS